MSSIDYKYTYEVHFPYNKELFYSDLEFGPFVEQFNHSPVGNYNGDKVAFMNNGNMVCYVKQVCNNKPF